MPRGRAVAMAAVIATLVATGAASCERERSAPTPKPVEPKDVPVDATALKFDVGGIAARPTSHRGAPRTGGVELQLDGQPLAFPTLWASGSHFSVAPASSIIVEARGDAGERFVLRLQGFDLESTLGQPLIVRTATGQRVFHEVALIVLRTADGRKFTGRTVGPQSMKIVIDRFDEEAELVEGTFEGVLLGLDGSTAQVRGGTFRSRLAATARATTDADDP